MEQQLLSQKTSLAGIIFDSKLHEISYRGNSRKLENKPYKCLLLLLSNQNQLVTRDELHSTIWTDSFVTESALGRCISAIRRTFQELEIKHVEVKVFPKKGYTLLLNEEEEEEKEEIPQEQQTDHPPPEPTVSAAIANKSNKLTVRAQKGLILFAICLLTIAAVLLTLRIFEQPAIDLELVNSNITFEQLEDTVVRLSPSAKKVAYLEFEDGVTYYNNSSGNSYIVIQQLDEAGGIKQKVTVPGWVSSFEFVNEHNIVAHTLKNQQCIIVIHNTITDKTLHSFSCQDDKGGSSIDVLSDNEILLSDGINMANSIYRYNFIDGELSLQIPPTNNLEYFMLIRVSPDKQSLALLASTQDDMNEIYIYDIKTEQSVVIHQSYSFPYDIRWVDENTLSYIDLATNELVTYALSAGSTHKIKLSFQSNGYFDIKNNVAVFGRKGINTTALTLSNRQTGELSRFEINASVAQTRLIDKDVSFLTAKVEKVQLWRSSQQLQALLAEYPSDIPFFDYELIGDKTLVATGKGIDLWQAQKRVSKIWAGKAEMIVEGSTIESLYFITDNTLFQLENGSSQRLMSGVASAYFYKGNLYLTLVGDTSLHKLESGQLTQIAQTDCSGEFSLITWVEQKAAFCIKRMANEEGTMISLTHGTSQSLANKNYYADTNANFTLTYEPLTSTTKLLHMKVLGISSSFHQE